MYSIKLEVLIADLLGICVWDVILCCWVSGCQHLEHCLTVRKSQYDPLKTPATTHPKTQCHACVPLNPHIVPSVAHGQFLPNSFQFMTNQWQYHLLLYRLMYQHYLLTHSMEQGPSWEASWSRNSPRFMEPEGSSPHSQAPATCPYPEPAQSSPHTLIPPPEGPYTPILQYNKSPHNNIRCSLFLKLSNHLDRIEGDCQRVVLNISQRLRAVCVGGTSSLVLWWYRGTGYPDRGFLLVFVSPFRKLLGCYNTNRSGIA